MMDHEAEEAETKYRCGDKNQQNDNRMFVFSHFCVIKLLIVNGLVAVELLGNMLHILIVSVTFGTSLVDTDKANDERDDNCKNDKEPRLLVDSLVNCSSKVSQDNPGVDAYEHNRLLSGCVLNTFFLCHNSKIYLVWLHQLSVDCQ